MEGRPSCWRIGDVEFQPDTGEIRRLDGRDGAATVRLRPQPSRLLALLAARGGALVTREEIREALWPDTYVDLDQSLSFCVRQIRHALGDEASSPTYVETLPRRGYRLLAAARPCAGSGVAERGDPAPAWRRRLALATVAAAAAAVAWWLAAGVGGHPPLRLAVMPFELAAPEASTAEGLASVSEALVVGLAARPRLELVGPRSTAPYADFPFPDLQRLAAELEVDYVVNARFLSETAEPELIVELIRLSDGSHPWAQRYSPPWRWRRIATDVTAAVEAALRSEPD